MESTKHLLVKGLNKVAPDLFGSVVASGVREFTHIMLDGDMASDWWCIPATDLSDTSNKFETSMTSGNGKFNSSLLRTPNIKLAKYGNGHLMTNTITQIGQNPYTYRAFDYEPRIKLTTHADILTFVNMIQGSIYSDAGTVKRINPTMSSVAEIENICLMFGLQYLKDQALLAEYVTYADAITETDLKNGKVHPSKLAAIAAPGVKYLYIGIPNANGGTSEQMFNGDSGYAGVAGMEFLERYNQILPTALSELRVGMGVSAPSFATAQCSGYGSVFWFAVPVMDDGKSWQRVWLCECSNASYANDWVGLGRVWHCGYEDSRYVSSADATLFRLSRDATKTLDAIGPLTNLDGSVTTADDVQKSYDGVANSFQKVFTPLMGPLGDIEFIAESSSFTSTQEDVTFDDFPDVVFKFTELKFSYKRLGVRLTRAWYEHYYTTGFGVYAPRASNIQANTLKTWTDDDINMLGVVSYNTPIHIDGSLVDQLQIRQTYKKNKEKACETDDWDKQLISGNMTWGQARQTLSAAGQRATFYAPVFSSLSTGAALEHEQIVASFRRDAADGPVTVNITRSGVAQDPAVLPASEARELYLTLKSKGASITTQNWDPNLSQEEVAALSEAEKEFVEIKTYADYDRRFIGMNMMLVYQFPWEALSIGGYPAVKEMPRQNAIMATIQSVCHYERFGKQIQTLWTKLSASSLLAKIG